MTSSVWLSGAKLTPITLYYFKDTGYYYDIDVSISVSPTYGKNKGCDFALGI